MRSTNAAPNSNSRPGSSVFTSDWSSAMINVFPPAGWACTEGLVPPTSATSDNAMRVNIRERFIEPSFLRDYW